MIPEATAGEELIKGGAVSGSRCGAMMKIRGHPHFRIRGRKWIFEEVRGRPERFEQDEALLHFESKRELFKMKQVGKSIKQYHQIEKDQAWAKAVREKRWVSGCGWPWRDAVLGEQWGLKSDSKHLKQWMGLSVVKTGANMLLLRN